MENRSIEEMIRKYETQDPPIMDRQHRFYRCPECGRKITYKYNHCHRCGKAITWDGMRKEVCSNGKKAKAGGSKSRSGKEKAGRSTKEEIGMDS